MKYSTKTKDGMVEGSLRNILIRNIWGFIE